MTHTYSVTGMTCTGCQAKVQSLLSKVPGVKNVTIDLPKGEAAIDMDKHISTQQFKEALKEYPKYQFSETNHLHQNVISALSEEETKSWFQTYKPILLIFWIYHGHYIAGRMGAGRFYMDALDESFYGRVLFGFLLF